MITVRELYEELGNAKNPDAVVALCVDGFAYSPFSCVIDESTPDRGDGCTGNFLIVLSPDSELRKFLAEVEYD